MTSMVYIAGVWDRGNFVQTVTLPHFQIQQSYTTAQTTYYSYKGIAFPLMFSLLPKRGNSNHTERIALMERFVKIFGKGCIDCLVAGVGRSRPTSRP